MSSQNPIYGRRATFVGICCARKGWNRDSLTVEQMNEIRACPGWIDPEPSADQMKGHEVWYDFVRGLWLEVIRGRPGVSLAELTHGLDERGITSGQMDGVIEAIEEFPEVWETEDMGYLNLLWRPEIYGKQGVISSMFGGAYASVPVVPAGRGFEGFRFADFESQVNALWALRWAEIAQDTAPGEAFRPPLVVISGPQGCGKSSLVRRLCGGEGYPQKLPSSVDGISSGHMVAVAFGGCRVVEIEGRALPKFQAQVRAGRPGSLASFQPLIQFLTSAIWWRARSGKGKPTMVHLSTLMFLTGAEEMELPPELLRRAVFIRLREFIPDVNAFGDSDWGSTPE